MEFASAVQVGPLKIKPKTGGGQIKERLVGGWEGAREGTRGQRIWELPRGENEEIV